MSTRLGIGLFFLLEAFVAAGDYLAHGSEIVDAPDRCG